ncbi:hypothetical protein ABPG75_008399 [Micractinium tetrahymenae]
MAQQQPEEGPLPASSLLELGRALLRASRSYPSRLLDHGPPEQLLRLEWLPARARTALLLAEARLQPASPTARDRDSGGASPPPSPGSAQAARSPSASPHSSTHSSPRSSSSLSSLLSSQRKGCDVAGSLQLAAGSGLGASLAAHEGASEDDDGPCTPSKHGGVASSTSGPPHQAHAGSSDGSGSSSSSSRNNNKDCYPAWREGRRAPLRMAAGLAVLAGILLGAGALHRRSPVHIANA